MPGSLPLPLFRSGQKSSERKLLPFLTPLSLVLKRTELNMSSELKYGGMTGVKMLAMTKELPKNRQESPIPMASKLQKMAELH